MTTKTDPEQTPERPLDAATEGIGGDSFYHGTIQKLHPRKNSGVVRTSSGREIPFSYQLVDLLGPVKHPRDLRAGLVVGYDMGWTAHGLRVTKIKTYRRAGEDPADNPAVEESQPDDGGAEGDANGD